MEKYCVRQGKVEALFVTQLQKNRWKWNILSVSIEKELTNMSVKTITKQNFNIEVLESEKPVLLDFWATWCGPCRMIAPVVEEIAAERSDIVVGKVNVDEQPELAQKFQIMSIPTLIVIKNGKITAQKVGVQPKAVIQAMIG